MTVSDEIKYIVDQIVIAYCNYKKFKDEEFGDNFEKYTAQLMALTGLDRDGALEYACEVVSKMNECEGVA